MAPASKASSSSSSSMSSGGTTKPVPQKLRRNERERKRVDQVNQGFNKLRDRVPKQPGCKQKLSKVETLREAVRYIQLLQSKLGYAQTESSPSSSSIDFPTPEHSPCYPMSMDSHCQQQTDFNISPFYPPPMMMMSNGGGGYGILKAQTSPGSSFYSDASSYDEQYRQ